MESSRLLILSVTGEAGVRCVIDELMSAGKNSHAGVRKVMKSSWLLSSNVQ